MFTSSAKRRKTSPTASVAVNASNTQSNPSTPKRASFQSPTKASLARSHPNLLPESAGPSQVQTRGQGLRQELLSRRTSQSVPKPSTAEPQTPKSRNEPAGDKPANSTTTGIGNFSGVVRNLFAAEPSRLPASSRTPLRVRQPPIRLVGSQNRNNDLQISKQAETKYSRGRPGLNNDAEEDEPELPPTPVQLGLSTQPDRPRGLASSSPGRSSGSSRQRTRLNESRHTSSPTKLRVQTQTVADSAAFVAPQAPAIAIAEEEAPEEAPESDAEASADEEEEEPSIPEAVLQKRSLRDSLSVQLARLQSDIASLENALEDSDEATTTSVDVDQLLLKLLTSTNPSCAEPAPENDVRAYSPKFPNPTALGSKPVPYLTLFAPGNLQLHSTTSTAIIDRKAHQIHVLELLAPQPWPAHIFGATMKVTVDVEEKQIKAVEVVKLRLGMGHQSLREWIRKRLEASGELHRYDVGGLVWGMGRWWEECVTRARGWRKLEERFHNKSSKKQKDSHEDVELLTQEDIQTFLPHLTRTSMEFELGTAKRVIRSTKGTADQKQVSTKVMLLWDLLLDWTGEVDETVGVAVAGMGSQGEQGVKDVFGKIFKRDGVFQAMEGVSGVLAKEGE